MLHIHVVVLHSLIVLRYYGSCLLDFEYLLWHALILIYYFVRTVCVCGTVCAYFRGLCYLAVTCALAQAYFSGAGHPSRPVQAFSALSHRGSLTDSRGPSPIQTTNGDSLGVCACMRVCVEEVLIFRLFRFFKVRCPP